MDHAGILGAAHGGQLDDLKTIVPKRDHDLLDAATNQIKATMQHIGVSRQTFGLIHADFHAGNFLFHRGEVRAIDFDACSFGYFLSDIAATTRMCDHPRYDEATVLHHFLAGYRSVRPLPSDLARHINTFKAANNLMLAIWITSRRDNPLIQSFATNFIKKQLGQMDGHLKNT